MTTTPVATVNSAMTRMATAMSPSTAPTRSSTSRTGTAVTFGNAAATALCTRLSAAAARQHGARRRRRQPGQRGLASVIEGALAVLANATAHQIARHAHAVHGDQPSPNDRRQRRRHIAAGSLPEHARERLALVGLH